MVHDPCSISVFQDRLFPIFLLSCVSSAVTENLPMLRTVKYKDE